MFCHEPQSKPPYGTQHGIAMHGVHLCLPIATRARRLAGVLRLTTALQIESVDEANKEVCIVPGCWRTAGRERLNTLRVGACACTLVSITLSSRQCQHAKIIQAIASQTREGGDSCGAPSIPSMSSVSSI